MPRGSRPGERRGGRQRGTPNKKTLIKNAVFLAVAAEPNRSPLDFMLALMRDPQVPLDLQIEMASAAAPLVHARPKVSGRTRPHPMEMRARRRTPVSPSAGEPAFSSPPRELVSSAPGDADISSRAENGIRSMAKAGTSLTIAGPPPSRGREDPLDFLLAVMHDPEAAPRHRVRAARIAAPYKHKPPEASRHLVEDEFGFKIDPVMARAIRDIAAKCDALARALEPRPQTLDMDPPAEKVAEYEMLLKQLDRQIETIAVPDTYNWPDLQSDDLRMKEIRTLAKSRGKLGPDDDAEEAYLIARTEAYRACPRHCAWCRISELELSRAEGRSLTETELHELDDLRAHFPAVAEHFAGRNWAHYKFDKSDIRVFSVVARRANGDAMLKEKPTDEVKTPDEIERQKRRPEADRESEERRRLRERQLGAERFREKPVKVYRIMESSERQRSERQNPEQKPK
jgi:hypothetical protein